MPALEDVNYRYFLEYAADLARARPITILDYGCGTGQLVAAMRNQGMDSYGVDIFYDAWDLGASDLEELLAGGVVRAFEESGRIPFEDGKFDLIISNQVFEHVEHMEPVALELARVLKADGLMLHHFPSRGVIREGHIGIPLAHRLPKGRFRVAYVAFLRRLGLGTFKGDLGILEWARSRTAWLDRYCFYRPYSEIASVFEPEFGIQHREIEYCRFRARDRGGLGWLLDKPLASHAGERIFRLLAFQALEMRKRGSSDH